ASNGGDRGTGPRLRPGHRGRHSPLRSPWRQMWSDIGGMGVVPWRRPSALVKADFVQTPVIASSAAATLPVTLVRCQRLLVRSTPGAEESAGRQQISSDRRRSDSIAALLSGPLRLDTGVTGILPRRQLPATAGRGQARPTT